jgi:hypothetical protein
MEMFGIIFAVLGIACLIAAGTKKNFRFVFKLNKGPEGEIGAGETVDNDAWRYTVLVVGVLMIGFGIFSNWPSGSTPDGRPRVIAPDGAISAPVYDGPSQISYRMLRHVPVETVLNLKCAAFGGSVPFASGGSSNLWNYVADVGWLNERYVSTGGAALVNGCLGSVSDPRVGTTPPDKHTGPYSTYTDEGADLIVYSDHTTSSRVVARLRGDSLVRIKCTYVGGPAIPAPRGHGPIASNNVWDLILSPSGWIPDSFVLTATSNAVAPSC